MLIKKMKEKTRWMWQYLCIITTLGRQKQNDQELRPILAIYTSEFIASLGDRRLYQNKTKNE